MKKIIGLLLSVGGLIAAGITGHYYLKHTSSVHAFGSTITLQTAPIWPLAVSGFILILGIVFLVSSKSK